MPRLMIPVFVLAMMAASGHKAWAKAPGAADAAETRYLHFQLMTGLHGYAGPQPAPGHFALSKSQLESVVHDVKGAIGTTGDRQRKLGFTMK